MEQDALPQRRLWRQPPRPYSLSERSEQQSFANRTLPTAAASRLTDPQGRGRSALSAGEATAAAAPAVAPSASSLPPQNSAAALSWKREERGAAAAVAGVCPLGFPASRLSKTPWEKAARGADAEGFLPPLPLARSFGPCSNSRLPSEADSSLSSEHRGGWSLSGDKGRRRREGEAASLGSVFFPATPQQPPSAVATPALPAGEGFSAAPSLREVLQRQRRLFKAPGECLLDALSGEAEGASAAAGCFFASDARAFPRAFPPAPSPPQDFPERVLAEQRAFAARAASRASESRGEGDSRLPTHEAAESESGGDGAAKPFSASQQPPCNNNNPTPQNSSGRLPQPLESLLLQPPPQRLLPFFSSSTSSPVTTTAPAEEPLSERRVEAANEERGAGGSFVRRASSVGCSLLRGFGRGLAQRMWGTQASDRGDANEAGAEPTPSTAEEPQKRQTPCCCSAPLQRSPSASSLKRFLELPSLSVPKLARRADTAGVFGDDDDASEAYHNHHNPNHHHNYHHNHNHNYQEQQLQQVPLALLLRASGREPLSDFRLSLRGDPSFPPGDESTGAADGAPLAMGNAQDAEFLQKLQRLHRLAPLSFNLKALELSLEKIITDLAGGSDSPSASRAHADARIFSRLYGHLTAQRGKGLLAPLAEVNALKTLASGGASALPSLVVSEEGSSAEGRLREDISWEGLRPPTLCLSGLSFLPPTGQLGSPFAKGELEAAAQKLSEREPEVAAVGREVELLQEEVDAAVREVLAMAQRMRGEAKQNSPLACVAPPADLPDSRAAAAAVAVEGEKFLLPQSTALPEGDAEEGGATGLCSVETAEGGTSPDAANGGAEATKASETTASEKPKNNAMPLRRAPYLDWPALLGVECHNVEEEHKKHQTPLAPCVASEDSEVLRVFRSHPWLLEALFSFFPGEEPSPQVLFDRERRRVPSFESPQSPQQRSQGRFRCVLAGVFFSGGEFVRGVSECL